jgi:hypothetical protein
VKAKANSGAILTLGHSTRPIDDFLELLRAHGVERVVDVRTIPRSRHNPQFNGDALAKSLPAAGAGIAYTHLKSLGGLRHPRADSRNLGWRNASFRGFADYMETPEFEEALAGLLELAAHKRCAIMCAEAVPWRCHRSLIADALTARGVPVEHIMSRAKCDLHRLTPFARVREKRVTYPAAPSPQAQLALEYQPAMASKKRKPKFTAAKEAKRQAREAVGSPPAERVIPDKRRRPQKHRKPLEEENAV